MKLDIDTLAYISCLTFLTQSIALFVQYLVNRTYRGVKWWLLSSALLSVGVIFMPMVTSESTVMFARMANPLTVLGQIVLYYGICDFLDKKTNKWVLGSIFIIFTLFYYYFIYIYNDISSRTLVLTTTLAVILFMTAHTLFFHKTRLITGSANFTASIFFMYGCFSAFRAIFVIISPPIRTYSDQGTILLFSFIIPIIASALWTFGIIIMVNQRLNGENREEKEKMQLVFTTSPDAAFISRLNDGLIVDVNAGFLGITGHSRSEVIGNSIDKIKFWQNPDDKEHMIEELKDKGICENMEFIFQRKDGSQLMGSISAKTLYIQTIPHIISIVQDVSERKRAEQKIQQLVQQLEIEKKIALLNANTDSLTGLANRRNFDEVLNQEYHRIKRSGSPFSLIMLDVDQFKNFNDRYGHLAGDDCLRQIGTALKTIVGRSTDFVARYGGEEFVAILTETEHYGATTLAERIRKAVEVLAIPNAASKISEIVTVSLGVVTVYTSNFDSPEQIVALADQALYRAKNGGRNRVFAITDNEKLDDNEIR
jgi:diguanylate cyclase (GGDEF)-like protein/PAS domain S-box-containing protein